MLREVCAQQARRHDVAVIIAHEQVSNAGLERLLTSIPNFWRDVSEVIRTWTVDPTAVE
jgi:hypothetical protein